MQPSTEDNSELIGHPGDVNFTKLELWSSQHDGPIKMLPDSFKEMTIYEDIETNYIRGELYIIDSNNLIANLPIIGNEKIEIEFKTPGRTDPYKFTAAVTEIANQTELRQGAQWYKIMFISPEFVRNQKMKFSKSYDGRLISDMANDIYTNYIKDVTGKKLHTVASTKYVSRVVPTMSPFRAINWLAKGAQAAQHLGGASFLFFENQHGYYFGPIEALYAKKHPAAIYHRNVVNTEISNKKDISKSFFNIKGEIELTLPDLLNNIAIGMYASKLISHDIVMRTARTVKDFNYFDTYEDMTHTTQNNKNGGQEITALHNDKRLGLYGESHIINAPSHYGYFDGQATNYDENTILERNSQLGQMGAIQLTIRVPGDSNRTVGEIVDINLPSIGTITQVGEDSESDKYLSGRYMIATCRHTISSFSGTGRTIHNMTMNVLKDSYENPLPQPLMTHWS